MKRRSASTERRKRGRLPPRSESVAGGAERGQGRPEAVHLGFRLTSSAFPRGWARAAGSAEEEFARIEAELHRRMQSGDVGGARRLLAEFDPTTRADPRLARWVRALTPPEVRVGSSGSTGSLEKNAAWLRKNATAHIGRWVALRDGELLESNPDHVALHRELERRGELLGVVFVRIADG